METMQAVLDQVGPDKHQAILVQARIEAARTVLAGAVSSQDGGGERGQRRVIERGGEECH